MVVRALIIGILSTPLSSVRADPVGNFDAATAFGARPGVSAMHLSPDGKSVAYLAPTAGSGSALLTVDLAAGAKPQIAVSASGKPDRLENCHWVSNDRLVCTVYGVVSSADGILPFSRIVAVDRSGTNLKVLSNQGNEHTRGYQLSGGKVIDWLPDEDGKVLMTRQYFPDAHVGSREGSALDGLGVDLVDTRTLAVKTVEQPQHANAAFISDGRGSVRIRGRKLRPVVGHQDSGIIGYEYRKQGARDWLPLSEFNSADDNGFLPLAVDHDLDIAYGLKMKDGRRAVYTKALDGSLTETPVYERPDVDLGGLLSMGRRNRVVGVTYATDIGRYLYLDPAVERLMKSLSRALPNQPNLDIVDSSVDEQLLLVFAGGDNDPGLYYLFDRTTRKLRTFLVARDELEGVTLATVKAVRYPAADGHQIPGYLTLPPGHEDAKGVAAIVMPHGGPSARDYWRFDWLAQYYAARGYAVLQPEYRGSSGYGEEWSNGNAKKSWRTAIGDVLDAGHWLVASGIADPSKLAIVGWSYGGYAALQCAVTEPDLFKAVIAIAPVTDWEMAVAEWRDWSNYHLVKEEIGEIENAREGSPARHADKIKAPVLLFHGALDRNVGIRQSRLMAERLQKAGVKHELVTWDDLDHYLDDSAARALMLRKSDEFLQAAMSAAPGAAP